MSRTETVVFAVRSDGSTVRARTLASPSNRGMGTTRKIFDLSRAEEVSIDGFTESTTTLPLLKAAVEFHKRRPNCTSENPPVRASVLGYEVVRNIKDIGRAPDRILREEEWRAPALDCFPLKTTLFLGRTKDELRIAKVDEAVEVLPGEPPTALFERPVSYVELSPLQRRQEFTKRYPEVACPDCLLKGDTELEELYQRRQGDRGK